MGMDNECDRETLSILCSSSYMYMYVKKTIDSRGEGRSDRKEGR